MVFWWLKYVLRCEFDDLVVGIFFFVWENTLFQGKHCEYVEKLYADDEYVKKSKHWNNSKWTTKFTLFRMW